MAKLMKPQKHKIVPPPKAVEEGKKIVLVGTYKEKQLAWITKHCVYNYPVKEEDELKPESCAKAKELWLYASAKGKRHCFAAEFVGIQSRDEFLAGNPTYKNLGPSKHTRYMVFKVSALDYGPRLEGATVFARVSDFEKGRGRTKKIAAAIKQFHDDGDFGLLADYLPGDLAKLPREQLRVCEAAVQLEMFSWDELVPIVKPSNGAFTAVELFAGAGGLSIGLEHAGINVVIANEIMPDFAATLKANHPHTNVINDDIHKIDFTTELRKLGLESVDVLSGGPPCQGFSTIGSKNRKDPRNSLFYEYLRAVVETKPKYTIFENVSGFKRMYDGFAYETLKKELDSLGYDTVDGILNAADYGAPQIRYRTIVLGWKRGLPPLELPKVTHGNKAGLLPYLTLMDAIGDLPALSAGGIVSEYDQPPQNDYQRKMRGMQKVLLEHNASNYGAKMQEILRVIPEGGSIKDLPERLRPKSGYCNTYARLLPNVPSPTITRNFGTPSSSRCVHPYQPRALSTREGARLQGFPDNYRFVGGKQSKNLQIGNAVPPILGEAIARAIKSALEGVL